MEVLTPTRILAPPPSKMSLPVELIQEIVDYMSVETQLQFARTSHAMRDMVYDDARWVAKLKAMGAWNEEDARRNAEEEILRRRQMQQRAAEEAVLGRTLANGTTTLFDATVEAKKVSQMPVTPVKIGGDLLDFQFDSPEAFGDFQSVEIESPTIKPLALKAKTVDLVSPLTILSSVVSRRGQAKVEFARVYRTLAPLYLDLVNSNSLDESAVFRHRQKLEEQAKLLKILELFGRAKAVDYWTKCQKRIAWIMETFERDAITQFEE
jgi:recyclin-1